MRKNYTFNLNVDNMNAIKQLVIFPCSYSNLMDAILNYLLQSPHVLNALMDAELNKIKAIIESVPE